MRVRARGAWGERRPAVLRIRVQRHSSCLAPLGWSQCRWHVFHEERITALYSTHEDSTLVFINVHTDTTLACQQLKGSLVSIFTFIEQRNRRVPVLASWAEGELVCTVEGWCIACNGNFDYSHEALASLALVARAHPMVRCERLHSPCCSHCMESEFTDKTTEHFAHMHTFVGG